MRDNIPVYHADDIFENMDAEVVEEFWSLADDVSYGDAEYTLIKGKDAYQLIDMACKAVTERRGESVSFSTPSDLTDDGVYFAIRG